ncbi:MAG TPA: DUF4153 domain-containing protein [Janthinobacterium sp.]|nr:DUF4153 domain-containing protein [Janthinobacterium sp.]
MQQDAPHDNSLLDAAVTMPVALARLAVGLLMGALLYFLYRADQARAWPSTDPYLFSPLVLLAILLPVLLISSLGHLAPSRCAVWIGAAGLIAAGLSVYRIWRVAPQAEQFPLLFVVCVPGFFIAQALVLAGAQDGRRIARYPAYFEAAWKLAIQLLFSCLFVGVLWLVLQLGAALFMLVKLDVLKILLDKLWFTMPVLGFAFAAAMHLSDVRPAIVRGIRTLLLVLLSWILPVAALMVAGFMLSLPFTGLAILWATRHAAAVLLGTSAVLVVLINAAFQSGEVSASVARLVGVSARLAALLPLPLTAIAAYALGVRVHSHGWSADRIAGAACVLVAACYALGYAWAARRRGPWLAGIAGVNVATAFVILAVLLALFSPLADPARLAVDDQMARFDAGKVGADKFDFDYLRHEGARYGRAALLTLTKRAAGADAARIRARASAALNDEARSALVAAAPSDIAANITVRWPAGARLPDSFLRQDWSPLSQQWEAPACLRLSASLCDAYLMDVGGDGKAEVLLLDGPSGTRSMLFAEGADGLWSGLGKLPDELVQCASLRRKLAGGDYQLLAPRVKDLQVGGRRIAVQALQQAPASVCPKQ